MSGLEGAEKLRIVAERPCTPWRRTARGARGLAIAVLASAVLVVGAWAADPSPGADEAESAGVSKKLERNKKKTKKTKETKKSKADRQRELVESGAKTAPAWYADALERYKGGKYLAAREILLPLEDSPRAADIQEKVKLLIADTYFQQGGALNLAEALARYKSFLTFFPSSEHAAYAQYQLGRSYFKQLGPADRDQSFTDSALAEYQKVVDLYPKSEYVDQAKHDILEAKALRARHEYLVGKFYWDYGEYDSAADRFETVLKQRPELPEREKALYMLSQSLYDAGERDKGDSYAARLAEDYPQSAYLSKLKPLGGGPKSVKKEQERDQRRDRDAARTQRHQVAQDRRRTRQIRKDSGLTPNLPESALHASAAPAPPATAPSEAQADAAAEGPLVAAPQASAAPAEASAASAKEREQAAKDEAAEEKAAQAKAAAEEARDRKAVAAAAKAAEKAAKPETPKQVKEREEREAKELKRREKAEAAEQAELRKQEEQERKRAEKDAAEAAKKARAKQANKKGKGGSKK